MSRVNQTVHNQTATPPDRDLVLAARAGEGWAAEALYRRHRKAAYRLASKLMRGPDREDLIQDAFLTALRCLDRMTNPDVFSSWLATVVVRTANQVFRREHRRRNKQFWLEQPPARTPSIEAFAELQVIEKMLAHVPPEARRAFALRHAQSMSIDEVARHMGRSSATVKRRLARVQQALDRHLPDARARF